MHKLEQTFILIGFISLVALVLIGCYYIVGLLPLLLQVPIGLLLLSVVGYFVCRIVRKSI